MRHRAALLTCVLFFPTTAPAQAPAPLPPGDNRPLLRLEARGPTALVTSLVFSSDGQALYAGGFDKMVRGWRLTAGGRFVPDEKLTYRIPIGAGTDGAVNALALSPDDRWLAVGGRGLSRAAAGLREDGKMWPVVGAMNETARRDLGNIYVFNRADRKDVRILRGHTGEILALAFVADRPRGRALLVSFAREQLDGDRYHGVLRLWDVAAEKELAVKEGLPETYPARPGLAAWFTGAGPTDVRAAAACKDGFLRVWAVAQGGALHKVADADTNLTVARLAAKDRLLTGRFGTGRAELKTWSLAQADGKPAVWTPAPVAKGPDSLCSALALASRTGGGQDDLAAVVLWQPKKGNQFLLQLLDLGKGTFGTLRGQAPLWKGTTSQPVVAAAPGGRHLAVGGGPDHTVRVYAVADLLKLNNAAAQVLRSVGSTVGRVAFVKRGNDLGLVLNPRHRRTPGDAPLPPQEGDLLFDLTRRSLTEDLKGWGLAAPDTRGWELSHAQRDGRAVLTVTEKGKAPRDITLPAAQSLADYALLPVRKPLDVPLLAVAMHELSGQSQLWLYNARTGQPARQYTGHLAPVTSLAFSADGRLLVSSSTDQTVCVWSLADLDAHLNKHGRISGLAVRRRDGKLVVARVDEDSPARGKLRIDDAVAGLVVDGKLRPLKSAVALYEALDRLPPDSTVTLRRGDPAGNDDVALKVHQGMDERKPLFTLFLSDLGRPKERQWIAWNRLGPYDSSALPAEDYVGWHFNKGERKEPAAFAPAREYRGTYRREGLLAALVRRGLEKDTPPEVRPAPKMSLLLLQDGHAVAADARGQIRLTGPKAVLRVQVAGRPVETLRAVAWGVGNGPESPLDLKNSPDGTWEVPLEITRGTHLVWAVAYEPEAEREPYRERVAVRNQAARPEVRLPGRDGTVVVQDPDFLLRAEVVPGVPEAELNVTVAHQHDGRDLPATTSAHRPVKAAPFTVEQKVKLRPGLNVLTVTARNKDALKGYEDDETHARSLSVILKKKKAEPPRVVLQRIEPLGPGAGDVQPVDDPRAPVVVTVPRVRVHGEVIGRAKLSRAEWLRGDGKPVSLAKFVVGSVEKLTIGEDIRLQPGKQVLRFRAAADDSDAGEGQVTVTYLPPVPTLLKLTPADGTVFHGEAKEGEALLLGQLAFVEDRRPYRLEITVKEQPRRKVEAAVDEKAKTLSAKVALAPGKNTVVIRLSNEWTAMTHEVTLSYLRPPAVVELKEEKALGRVSCDLVARVRSPLPLLEDGIAIEVGGRAAAVAATIEPEKEGLFRVRLKDVPLQAEQTEHEVRLWVSNAEGRSLLPGTVTVRRPAAAPVIRTEPGGDLSVMKSQLTVTVKVRSDRKLTRVRVVRQGQGLAPVAVDVAGQRVNAEGLWELAAKVDVPLKPGANLLHAEATSDRGTEASPQVKATRTPSPVRVEIIRIVPFGAESGVKPKLLPGDKVRFPEMGHSKVELHGEVHWGDDDTGDARRRQACRVQVYVNGLQQLPAPLQAGKLDRARNVTPFKASMLLTRKQDNRVKLALPDLPQQEDSRREFSLDCARPETLQRLHVLAISTRARDRAAFKQRVVKTFAGPPERTPFSVVTVDGLMTGDQVRLSGIDRQLLIIQNEMGKLAKARPGSDVLVVYYEGAERVAKRGNLLKVHAVPPGEQPFALDFYQLAERLADVPGAALVFLDVDAEREGSEADRIASWPKQVPWRLAQLAILRFSWAQPGKVQEAGLLSALQIALAQGRALADVTGLVLRSAEQRRGQGLQGLKQVPRDLDDLPVGYGDR